MIPLKDMSAPRRLQPIVLLLILLNLLAFLFELSLGRRELRAFIATFSVVPAHFISDYGESLVPDPGTLLSLLTSMFLHGGWAHILGNMLYLWVFGKAIESRLGHGRFLVFYLLSGIGASLVHILFNLNSDMPTLGASGAIAGVLGAYIVTFPQSRILTLVPFLFLATTMEIPAVLSIGLWFFSQLFNATASIVDPRQMGGVAWWAHVGGFIVGMLLMKLIEPPRRRQTWDFEGPYYGRY